MKNVKKDRGTRELEDSIESLWCEIKGGGKHESRVIRNQKGFEMNQRKGVV